MDNKDTVLFRFVPQELEESDGNLTNEMNNYQRKRITQIRMSAGIILIIGFICYMLSALWNGFFFLFLICCATSLLTVKLTFKYSPFFPLVFLEATGETLSVECHFQEKSLIEMCNISYTDIKSAHINTDFSAITIMFKSDNSLKTTFRNGVITSTDNPNLIKIPFADYSEIQYFFLYIAPQFFDVKCKNKLNSKNAILKKYGSADEYINTMEIKNRGEK